MACHSLPEGALRLSDIEVLCHISDAFHKVDGVHGAAVHVSGGRVGFPFGRVDHSLFGHLVTTPAHRLHGVECCSNEGVNRITMLAVEGFGFSRLGSLALTPVNLLEEQSSH